MKVAFDWPVVALGTELAFSTLTTWPASVPKYNVDDTLVWGHTVNADTLEVKNVEFSSMKFGAFELRSSSLKSSQSYITIILLLP